MVIVRRVQAMAVQWQSIAVAVILMSRAAVKTREAARLTEWHGADYSPALQEAIASLVRR